MEKQAVTEEFPRLTVYLPKEMEQAIYADYLSLARSAVEEARNGVVKNERYMNQKQLAQYFKCSPRQINEWRVQGLRSFEKGKEIMFDMEDVHEFINTLKK